MNLLFKKEGSVPVFHSLDFKQAQGGQTPSYKRGLYLMGAPMDGGDRPHY